GYRWGDRRGGQKEERAVETHGKRRGKKGGKGKFDSEAVRGFRKSWRQVIGGVGGHGEGPDDSEWTGQGEEKARQVGRDTVEENRLPSPGAPLHDAGHNVSHPTTSRRHRVFQLVSSSFASSSFERSSLPDGSLYGIHDVLDEAAPSRPSPSNIPTPLPPSHPNPERTASPPFLAQSPRPIRRITGVAALSASAYESDAGTVGSAFTSTLDPRELLHGALEAFEAGADGLEGRGQAALALESLGWGGGIMVRSDGVGYVVGAGRGVGVYLRDFYPLSWRRGEGWRGGTIGHGLTEGPPPRDHQLKARGKGEGRQEDGGREEVGTSGRGRGEKANGDVVEEDGRREVEHREKRREELERARRAKRVWTPKWSCGLLERQTSGKRTRSKRGWVAKRNGGGECREWRGTSDEGDTLRQVEEEWTKETEGPGRGGEKEDEEEEEDEERGDEEKEDVKYVEEEEEEAGRRGAGGSGVVVVVGWWWWQEEEEGPSSPPTPPPSLLAWLLWWWWWRRRRRMARRGCRLHRSPAGPPNFLPVK
ncbi:hypothetical protein BDK51DRAFT_28805, partial [Blyttiomyces helicus]